MTEQATHLASFRAAAAAQPFVFTEREALRLVADPLEQLKAASAEERLAFVFEALRELAAANSLTLQLALKGAASALLRSGLPVNALEAVRLVEAVTPPRLTWPHKAVLSAVETAPATPALREALAALRRNIDDWHGSGEARELHQRIDRLLHGAVEKPVAPAAAWSQQVFREMEQSDKAFAWRALFQHARSLTQSTAPRKWQAEAAGRIGNIGREEFLDAARRWLALSPTPGWTTIQTPDAEADYQKGFVWSVGALGDTSVAPDLANFALACFRKIPMVGAVSHRVGNACVNALAAMPGLDAVAQLSRLAARVKYDVARRLIEKALAEAAARNGVSREDLEAMSVPALGLDAHGVREETAGDCVARLAIENGGVVLSWSRDGKPLKSIPAAVKSDHAELVTSLKKTAKELDAILATLRIRLERLLLSDALCPLARWQEWYRDHPVVSHFARRLIWEIGGTTAIWHEGRWIDWAGHPVEAPPESGVRLWHPIRADVQTVLSWRCWLEDHEVRQPFKQAHREVYLLTDAERATGDYSNRFAAHIVKQHQFSALCRERGWQFQLMGQWDSHNTPYLDLPRHGLRAEFDVEFPEDEETTGHGVYLAIRTGPVSFLPRDTPRGGMPMPVRIEDVPPVVFSEVMRDCDLLVGVCSIGTDPEWTERNPRDGHEDYWRGFAFGELTAASETRKAVLTRLLPKLAIRDRCRIEGRYLEVRGSLHEYRIHLGSGNVLLEPGSRYLCIVQGPGDTAERVPLPFEGDRILAVILSKAFLLVNDAQIRDESIRRQL